MNLVRRARPNESLDAWLDAATRGLCDDARERVAEEIASHFSDALAEARAGGVVENEAIAKAVASLGDARRARRRLRRQHLTKRESRVLNCMIEERANGTAFYKSLSIPSGTLRVVLMVVAAPFALVTAIIAGFVLVNDDLTTSAVQSLPALAIGGLLVFVLIGGMFLGKIVHKWKLPLSLSSRARLSGIGNAVSFVYGLLLFLGMVIAAIWARREAREDFEAMSPTAHDQWASVAPAIPTFDWFFVMLTLYFGIFSIFYFVVAIWYVRFSAKLRRLGNDPPSAMV